MSADRVLWTGLNVRDVTRVCRELVERNAVSAEPWIWFVGRSRIEPDKNTVGIRTADGVLTVRAGDTIVRHDDGTFTVDTSHG